MAKRFHKSRLQTELRDVIKRIRQLYGALRLWVSIQSAQVVTHIEDDVISRVDNLLPLARFIFGSRLSLGLRSLGSFSRSIDIQPLILLHSSCNGNSFRV